MIARTTHKQSVDRRNIVTVVFEQETPEADALLLEVTFEYLEIDPIGIKTLRQTENRTPWTLNMLACVRADTNETVVLTPEEMREVRQTANEYAYYKITDD